MSESGGDAITTVLSILVIVDIVGNSLVCLIIKRNRDMRIPMNYLLVNLAVADIVFAAFITPSAVFRLSSVHPEGVTGTVLCKFLTGGNVAWVGGISSIVTLATIAIERYNAVMYPHGNRWKLTKRKLKVIVPVSWIFAAIFLMPLFLIAKFDQAKHFCTWKWPEMWMQEAYCVVWLVLLASTLALMVGLYSKVVYTLWFKRNENNQLTYQQQGVMKVRKRVTLMVVTVSVIFGISWGTDSIIYLLRCLKSYNIAPVAVTIAQTMVLFNSAVNPFVYALLNQQFRQKVKEVICCIGSVAHRVQPKPQNVAVVNNTTTHPVELETAA